MLVHSRTPDHHGKPQLEVPYDGSTTGMAAAGILLSPLTVQQNVPSLGSAQTGRNKQVNPTLEQGDGRAPGWKWGWMRKNIPFSPRTAGSHKQRKFGPVLRPEQRRGSGHPPGSGPGQTPGLTRGSRPFMSLGQPETVYYTAMHAPLTPWAEPV